RARPLAMQRKHRERFEHEQFIYLFSSGTSASEKLLASPLSALSRFCVNTLAIFSNDERVDLGSVMQLSALGHDPSLRDIFLPLCKGGTLHMAAKPNRELFA